MEHFGSVIHLIGMSQQAANPVPSLTVEQLPTDVASLQHMLLEALTSLQERDRDLTAAYARIDRLLQRLYGRRGERFDPNQPLLFDDDANGQGPAPAAPSQPEPRLHSKRRAKPHGRRPLPDTLPRQSRHHQLTEMERLCQGCGQLRSDIGADKSEQLDYRPASLFVIEHFVHKYVCPRCSRPKAAAAEPPPPPASESPAMSAAQPQPALLGTPTPTPPAATDQPPQASAPRLQPTDAGPRSAQPTSPCQVQDPGAVVLAAAKPAMPIAKGLPGPGLLAHLIVSKYVDHLPLHRLERIYERQGVLLPRSTLCDWLAACAGLLRPLYQRLIEVVLQSRALHTDDTPVKMQEPASHQLRTARLWGYLGDAAHPYNVFDFTQTRQRDGPQQFLTNYRGYLHADAFSGYDRLYLPDSRTSAARIIEVACNAHARRKFYEARTSDSVRAHRALGYYLQVYTLEKRARELNFTEDQYLRMRQDLALPILRQFQTWLEEEQGQVVPKSPMREAIGYALNNWTALIRYTEAGFLSIDNNAAEREMKRIAIGRKNWLFVGSPQGGRTAAVLLSFASTCLRLGVEPWAYFQDVLTRLPSLAAGQLDLLLPDCWQTAQRAAAPARATPAGKDTASPPSPTTAPGAEP